MNTFLVAWHSPTGLELLLAIVSLAEHSEEALEKGTNCLATVVLERVPNKERRVLNNEDIPDLRYTLLKKISRITVVHLHQGDVWIIAYLSLDWGNETIVVSDGTRVASRSGMYAQKNLQYHHIRLRVRSFSPVRFHCLGTAY